LAGAVAGTMGSRVGRLGPTRSPIPFEVKKEIPVLLAS
jgi:hypothetical protein